MDTNQLQTEVKTVFTKAFGLTPLSQRLDDMMGEMLELLRFNSVENIREELGDLLASALQLANESGWDASELVKATLAKIERRQAQYASLGRKKKVAIYGGAFDPIHLGHIQVAQLVLNFSRTFDEVWLMPAYRHMYNKTMLPPEQRLEMCRLAAQVDLRITVSDYEIKNQFAGETLAFTQKLLTENFAKDEYDFSLILGLDNANTFMNWPNSEYLERLVRFVIVGRQGYQPQPSDWYTKQPHIFIADEKSQILGTSSTEVRQMITDGNSEVARLVDYRVLEYIKQNGLYAKGEKGDA